MRLARRATASDSLATLLAAVQACRACETFLPLGPRPVLQADARARVLVVGQALLIGHHAQRHYLRERRQPTLAKTVRRWRDYAPRCLPLPHPSPRNQPWMLRHPWFAREVLPALEDAVAHALA